MGFREYIVIAGLFSATLSAASVPSAPDLKKAEDLYQQTNYEASIAALDRASNDPAVQFLLGRDYFMSGDFKRASDHMEKAITLSPGNSEYQDWLGRVYGKRAETANPLLAPGWASKARQAFEKSVALDGNNRDALDDLFDYYLEAPGFLGGGYDKAEAIADKVSAIDPPQGFHDRSRLDEKRKETNSAEQHLRQAVAAAPQSVGHLIALAKFLAKQGRNSESDAVIAQAQQVSPNNPRIWLAEADILVKQQRNLDEARKLLNKYLQSPITADDPPREEALRLLKQAGGA